MWLMPMKNNFACRVVRLDTLVVITHRRRANALGFMIHVGGVFGVAHWQAGFQVNLFYPVDGVVDLESIDQAAVFRFKV